jgi:hypothetical protein
MSAASVYGVRTWLGDRVLPDPILVSVVIAIGGTALTP